ncbi:MAG TPA: rhomboid family intramembrane serine protease [Vicinamibacterales bacterium]|nr:rhomboid family intramembrane serine protease [Vicinamibacterales bacterium]
MFRQKTGSVVCASCGSLVGVRDEKCYSCGRRNPGLWGFGPVLRRFGNDFGFTTVIVYGCCALYALSLVLTVASGGNLMGGSVFSILGPNSFAADALGASGANPVFVMGRWWTLLSAGWLHGGALHILFNMMWVRQLGPSVEDIYGGARMVIIYTLSSVTGFLLSSVLGIYGGIPFFSGAGYTLGASAPIFGLLGALVYYGKRGGSSMVRSQAMSYALTMGVFGLIMPGIDNAAHLGGFAGGYAAGMWLDPLKRERMDHFIGAAASLVATGLAIVTSMIIEVPLLVRYLLNR